MLVRFVVSNYLSFGEETEFNMLTGSVRRKKEHIYKFGDVELLKTAAIYGPNGAGKSNLIRAISLLKNIITNKEKVNDLQIEMFRLNPIFKKKPTLLEIEFISEEKMYSYGIILHKKEIIEEWLSVTTGKTSFIIFERVLKKGNTKIKFNENILNTEEDKVRIKLYEEELLPNTKTLLQMLYESKRKFEDVQNVFQWFENKLSIIYPSSRIQGIPSMYYFDENFKEFVSDLLKNLNTGISELKLETFDLVSYFGLDDKDNAENIKNKLEGGESKFAWIEEDGNHIAVALWENDKIVVKRLIALHSNNKNKYFEFEIDEESDGTKRILEFFPPFYFIIRNSFTVIIDEIDQSIHTHLLKKIIHKFVNDNNTKGQLIFTTHDSNLLDQKIFRQDEIWFTEKKKTGETIMYPLSDFKIRHDLDIEKGYLKGRFGAIPFLGNLDDLNWHVYAS